jgi:ketosteroid isomerase-like protein
LGLLALGFLIALRTTQQAKYLLWAGITTALLLTLFVIERFWVTDNELIEAVVYDVASAVEAGDAKRVAEFMAPEARVSLPNDSYATNPFLRAALGMISQLQGIKLTPQVLETQLARVRLDYVKISGLQTHVGEQSRQGTAEFRVHVMGQQLDPFHTIATPARGMGWSFGLRETSPRVWKITRITPTSSIAELQNQ